MDIRIILLSRLTDPLVLPRLGNGEGSYEEGVVLSTQLNSTMSLHCWPIELP